MGCQISEVHDSQVRPEIGSSFPDVSFLSSRKTVEYSECHLKIQQFFIPPPMIASNRKKMKKKYPTFARPINCLINSFYVLPGSTIPDWMDPHPFTEGEIRRQLSVLLRESAIKYLTSLYLQEEKSKNICTIRKGMTSIWRKSSLLHGSRMRNCICCIVLPIFSSIRHREKDVQLPYSRLWPAARQWFWPAPAGRPRWEGTLLYSLSQGTTKIFPRNCFQ